MNRCAAAEMAAGAASAPATVSRFDSLPAVTDAAGLTGLWRGEPLHTGHLLDGLLERHGWFGKRFLADGAVHPLLFGPAPDSLRAVDPRRLPLRLAIAAPGLARSLPARLAFRLAMPLLSTRRTGATVQLCEYRGRKGCALVYDAIPVVDHFRQHDANTLIGAMEHRDIPGPPLFFLLARNPISRIDSR
jgi:hypothetical protein